MVVEAPRQQEMEHLILAFTKQELHISTRDPPLYDNVPKNVYSGRRIFVQAQFLQMWVPNPALRGRNTPLAIKA